MRYIEDILTTIAVKYNNLIEIEARDLLVIESFYEICQRGESLTKNQGTYLLKLLKKYQEIFREAGLDYIEKLKDPLWKTRFRVLDLSKKLYVEIDEDVPYIWMKFPYSLKEQFEKEFGSNLKNLGCWDNTKKARKFNLYECNPIHLNDFAIKHGFEISENFIELMANLEEILSQQEMISPRSQIINEKVFLINASNETHSWWNQYKTGNTNDDLFLAKSMGFFLEKSPENVIEKITSSSSTNFWMKSEGEFLRMIRSLSGKFVLVLDRVHNNFNWLEKFTEFAEKVGFSSEEIKICFRTNNEENSKFNEWIKLRGYGGKVDTGKILIFNHKPAKWIFKNSEEVKIIATNNIYPSTDSITKDWMNSHPCVIYLGDIRPSKIKDQNIVEL